MKPLVVFMKLNKAAIIGGTVGFISGITVGMLSSLGLPLLARIIVTGIIGVILGIITNLVLKNKYPD